MVTQAEVVYIDEVLRHCSAEPDASDKDGGGQSESSTPPSELEPPPPGAALEFFDPLLHVPPSVLAKEKERELQSTWATDHALIILIPLRLGLDSLNPAYIPGR